MSRNQTRAKADRPARVPMNASGKLTAPNREGYVRYWTLRGPDHPGKVDQMVAAYWDFVKDEDGNHTEQPAGNGNTHVLMEIEQKYYNEDMAAQQAKEIDTTQGKLQALGDSEYVPMGRKEVVEREII